MYEHSSISYNSLPDACEEIAGKQDVISAFRALALPVPDAGEFIKTRHGFIAALPDFGAVIRIEQDAPKDRAVPPDHPLVLRPIGTMTGAYYRLELCPGVPQVGVTLEDALFLEDEINRIGMVPQFTAIDDCGYLPVITVKFPQGLPVVIDRTDMWWIDTSYQQAFNAASYAHLDPQTISGQRDFYRPLCEAFNDHIHGNIDAMAFWRQMKQAVSRKILFAAWEAKGGDKVQKGIDLRTSGEQYARRIRRDPAFSSLFTL